jgi:hypothetical protein
LSGDWCQSSSSQHCGLKRISSKAQFDVWCITSHLAENSLMSYSGHPVDSQITGKCKSSHQCWRTYGRKWGQLMWVCGGVNYTPLMDRGTSD